MHKETLLELLTDTNHWIFEIISHLVVDGVLVGICYPAIKHLRADHKKFHKHD